MRHPVFLCSNVYLYNQQIFQCKCEDYNLSMQRYLCIGDCTEILPGCLAVWNYDVKSIYVKMIHGLMQPDELEEICRCVK